MLNITLTLTAAPELIAAISNMTNALKYQNVKALENANSDSTSRKIDAGHNFQQVTNVQNAPASAASQAAKTEQYVQTVLPIDILGSSMKQGGASGAQLQNQGQTDAFQSNAQAVPTTVQSYTMEQLSVAGTQLVDAGRRAELVSLLSSFGVKALTALPKEQYGAFATSLRALGAKI
ncbi:hypothetical protein JK636_04845 [Clostridium sp. YIM B02515]|uniref:Uncharacterized protein n=1 Tax=Clostridium rhizosphaerae TaxID=2803861 RepID=A0ABS1T6W0_9CLOT|nr:hypothetical protein [Clostridium rhizosphaerae]MBL4935083.1 hypothetical protein [Clostridium rhizosphaerae]